MDRKIYKKKLGTLKVAKRTLIQMSPLVLTQCQLCNAPIVQRRAIPLNYKLLVKLPRRV